MEEEAVKQLKTVMDPHIGASVYDMGLIHDLNVDGNNISLKFRPTSPFCPMGIQLAVSIKNALESIEGIGKVKVEIMGHVQEKEINKKLNTE